MKTPTVAAPCTCGHDKSRHNPAGKCLVQVGTEPTGRGERRPRMCDCRHFQPPAP